MSIEIPADDIDAHWRDMDRGEIRHRAGQGNWGAFRALGMSVPQLFEAAELWERQLAGVRLPWLCWNASEDWCLVQQKLVQSAGWTPVVGYDPRVGPPRTRSRNAIVVDFNRQIDLPVMYPHFVLELAFRFCDRLAFWHSDLLLPLPLMDSLGQRFASTPDGTTVATKISPGLRHFFDVSKKRHWELVGCTTRAASRSQFEQGCGWWMEFWNHPNCTDPSARACRRKYYWDHGAGIYFWQRKLGGKVELIRDRAVHRGHFTKIGKPDYVRSVEAKAGSDAQRSMQKEIQANFDLDQACRMLGLYDIRTNQTGVVHEAPYSAS